MVLNGGHSGKDINKNRGNPIVILGKILAKLNINNNLFLNHIDGGTWVTAIPRKAECIITATPLNMENLCSTLQELEKQLQVQYNNPNISINILHIPTMDLCFDNKTTSNIIKYISNFPDGQILAKKNGDKVILSTNLGTIFFENDALLLENSIRSNLNPELTQEFISRLQKVENQSNLETIDVYDFPRILSRKRFRIYKIPSTKI